MGLLTAVLAFQVYRVWRFKYQKLSCFNICLSSSLLWGICRTSLLLSYTQDNHVAERIGLLVYLLLFVVPSCLQFLTFSAVCLHFYKVALQLHHSVYEGTSQVQLYTFVFVLSNVVFSATNITSAVLLNEKHHTEASSRFNANFRVIVSEVFTICISLILTFATLKMRRLEKEGRIVESQGITIVNMTKFTASIVVLFVARSAYNFAAIFSSKIDLWGYKWTFLSDHSSRSADDGWAFVAFVAAVFFWEWLPIFLVTLYFWVRATNTSSEYEPLIGRNVVSFQHDDDSSDDEDPSFSINVDGAFNDDSNYIA